ncbi:MAG: hypothetical protein ACLRX9_02505 [Streptococcus salivarius]
MIEAIIDDHLKRFAREWYVGLDERYYVQHYSGVLRSNLEKASSPEPAQRLQSRNS